MKSWISIQNYILLFEKVSDLYEDLGSYMTVIKDKDTQLFVVGELKESDTFNEVGLTKMSTTQVQWLETTEL